MTRTALALLVIAACSPADRAPPDTAADTAARAPQGAMQCDTAAARRTVEQLGSRLRNVSLLAPDSVLERELRESYGNVVAPTLLDSWLDNPSTAPGRQTSSPWPRGIDVSDVSAGGDGCVVNAAIVEVTSADTTEVIARDAVTLTLAGDGSRVTAWNHTAPDSPADVISRYYEAIDAGDYRRAYSLWADGGRASGQTYDEFASGFEATASVAAETGTPGRIEGAAGSRYVEVPVVIRATTRSGAQQRFEGTYTLRRSVVDGATPEQQRWQIHSADVVES